MKAFSRTRVIPLFTSAAFALLGSGTLRAQVAAQAPQYPTLPSETPAKFNPVTDSFDYVKRTTMIPMRDGTKLFTVIVVPRGAKGAPMLLTDYRKATQRIHHGPGQASFIELPVVGKP